MMTPICNIDSMGNLVCNFNCKSVKWPQILHFGHHAWISPTPELSSTPAQTLRVYTSPKPLGFEHLTLYASLGSAFSPHELSSTSAMRIRVCTSHKLDLEYGDTRVKAELGGPDTPQG